MALRRRGLQGEPAGFPLRAEPVEHVRLRMRRVSGELSAVLLMAGALLALATMAVHAHLFLPAEDTSGPGPRMARLTTLAELSGVFGGASLILGVLRPTKRHLWIAVGLLGIAMAAVGLAMAL